MPTQVYGTNGVRIDGATDVVSRRQLGFAASDGLLRTCACLSYARIAHEQHAGIGMGWSAPMDSDVLVHVFQSVPGQDFLGPTADELRVFARRCLALNGGSHDCKSSPKVAAIRT